MYKLIKIENKKQKNIYIHKTTKKKDYGKSNGELKFKVFHSFFLSFSFDFYSYF